MASVRARVLATRRRERTVYTVAMAMTRSRTNLGTVRVVSKVIRDEMLLENL